MKMVHESCMVGDLVVNFLIDTGSQSTVLPYSLASLAISPVSSAVLRAYGGGKVNVVGKIQSATITFHDQSHSGDMVTSNDTRPILGMYFLPYLRMVRECAPLTRSSSGFVAQFPFLKKC